MKISSKDFRVREGDEVNLKKWPTTVKPVYKQGAECPGHRSLHGNANARPAAQIAQGRC
jgi:hypothetical protein